jgi:hypothetical protein
MSPFLHEIVERGGVHLPAFDKGSGKGAILPLQMAVTNVVRTVTEESALAKIQVFKCSEEGRTANHGMARITGISKDHDITTSV